jgi:hypothetical protein
MLFGDSTMLSRLTTQTANLLVFLVSTSNLIFCRDHIGASKHLLFLHMLLPSWKLISMHFNVPLTHGSCKQPSASGCTEFSWQLLIFFFLKLFHELICLNVETGGSDGLLAQKTLEITDEDFSSYKNQGGYDMLGRTKDQIRTTEQVNGAMASCQALKLDALVIIGGMLPFINQLRFQYTAAQHFSQHQFSTLKVSQQIPMLLNLLRLLPRRNVQQRYIEGFLWIPSVWDM